MSFRWAVRVVVEQYLSSMGVSVEGGTKVNHDLRRDSLCQHRISTAIAGLDVSAGGWEKELWNTNTTFIVFIFLMHWPGLPISGSPLVFSFS
jgi:hypothetical protein